MANWTYNQAENSGSRGHNNRLDLHGVRHYDVHDMVENFILTNQDAVPLTIVCGNSVKMNTYVKDVMKRLSIADYDNTVYSRFILRKI